MYMTHACFYACCIDCVGVKCVAAIVKNRVFSFGVCCVVDVIDFVFSVCIVMRGAAGARVSSCCMTCSFLNAGRGCNRLDRVQVVLSSPVSLQLLRGGM